MAASGSGSGWGKTDAVKERRLRPIYELLDSGNNKKVIQEADRILKKQPNFPCVKVLKGLAHLRMGKKEECLLIINPIIDEIPTDENTVQALSICYRELDKPEMICQLLENACKKEKSEDLLISCFMSYARIGDYQKQHQTAMALYKSYPKVPYFAWGVMSLYVKSLREPKATAEKLTLPLAERMMAKFMEDTNSKADHEITLYALVLIQQGKDEKAFEILNQMPREGTGWKTGVFPRMMIKCLRSMNLGEKMMDFLEMLMVEGKDEWQYFFQYVSNYGHLETERVNRFLEKMQTTAKATPKTSSSKGGIRAILLARLMLYDSLRDRKMDLSEIDPIPPLNTHLDLFGDRPFYFRDVCIFLKCLDTLEEKDLFLQLAESKLEHATTITDTIQRHVNLDYLTNYLKQDEVFASASRTMEFVDRYQDQYLDYRKQLLSASVPLDPRESYPQDDFLYLASLTLVESFWSYRDHWKGYYATSDMTRGGVCSAESVKRQDRSPASSAPSNAIEASVSEESCMSNGLSHLSLQEQKFNLPEEEFPILLAMALLEYGLERSQASYSLRVLLGKVYTFSGAIQAGTEQFMRLDIKHAQIESLGYLYLWKTVFSGVFSDATRVINHAECFYNGHNKESLEHILSCYKYGTWSKILEFMQFRDHIIRSLQAKLIKIEKQLLEYMKDANSMSSTIQVAQRETFDVKSEILDVIETFSEHRDFKILGVYHSQLASSDLKKLGFEDDKERLKIRGVLLYIMNNFVLCMTEGQDEEQLNEKLDNIESTLSVVDELMQKDFKKFNTDAHFVDGPWLPRMYKYSCFGFLKELSELCRVIFKMAKDPQQADVNFGIEKIGEAVTSGLRDRMTKWRSLKHTLLNFSNLTDEVFISLEALGFICILTNCLKFFLQKAVSGSTKGKKKKCKEALIDGSSIASYNSFIQTLVNSLRDVETEILNFEFASGSWYPAEWKELEPMWQRKVSEAILVNILPRSMPLVMDKLNSSLLRAYSDMRSNASAKRTYVESLFLSA